MSGQQETPPSASQPGTDKGTKQLSIDVLDGEHREPLALAIVRILSTDIAEITYAQIIDGLPLADIAYESLGYSPPRDHPINQHEELCPGILEKVREFREQFRPEILYFDSTLLFEYQAAAPLSRAFKTRLIELVAVSVHQIAVILFKLDMSLHKNDGVATWTPPKSDEFYWSWFPDGPLPTLFSHPWYEDFDQYPEGVADMVGYWAEARILGGVVLFDRREDADLGAVYFHSDRKGTTYRIYKLLPEQKQALLDFFTADSTSAPSNPLPILGDQNNRQRIDPEEPIQETGIYRNV